MILSRLKIKTQMTWKYSKGSVKVLSLSTATKKGCDHAQPYDASKKFEASFLKKSFKYINLIRYSIKI